MRLRWFLAISTLFTWLIIGSRVAWPIPTPALQEPVVHFQTVNDAPDPNIIFNQVNSIRHKNNLVPLVADAYLTKIAQARAKDMAEHRYYGHKNTQGKIFNDLITATAHHIDYGCENLDLQLTTIADIYVTDWLNSTKGHRECLLNSEVTQAGYAVVPLIFTNSPSEPNMFIVVAIHATEPQEQEVAAR